MEKVLSTHKVVVAGLGLTGQASVRFLLQHDADVRVWDSRENMVIPETLKVPVCLGTPQDGYFNDVSLMVLSPGISPYHPVVEQARQSGCEVIGDVELFAWFSQTPAVGITGSNGKTTVTLLVTHLLREAGLKVTEAGNVGVPVLDTLNSDFDAVVLELSSFQLETTSSLQLKAACILNLSDDHLDRHGSMPAYLAAKQRIFAHAKAAAVWRGQSETRPVTQVGHIIEYGLGKADTGYGVHNGYITLDGNPLLDTRHVPLTGAHNLLNIQAALALAAEMGVPPEQAAKAVQSFTPAPHRCVEIARHRGVRYIDDSKATNAGATMAAIEGLAATTRGRILLIAGGDAKGADLSVLKEALTTHVYRVFAIGKDAHQFLALTNNAEQLDSLEQAVANAAQLAQQDDIVLLSPACASLDMFDNYIHRAQVFSRAVEKQVAA